jgi:hypothetical protein
MDTTSQHEKGLGRQQWPKGSCVVKANRRDGRPVMISNLILIFIKFSGTVGAKVSVLDALRQAFTPKSFDVFMVTVVPGFRKHPDIVLAAGI